MKIKILLISLLLFIGMGFVYAVDYESFDDEFFKEFDDFYTDNLDTEEINNSYTNNFDTVGFDNSSNNHFISKPSIMNTIKSAVDNNKFVVFLVCMIPGLITSTIVFLIYFFRNNMIRNQKYAHNYLDKDSVNITFREDSYRGTDTTKRKK